MKNQPSSTKKIHVSSEVARLRRVLVHSPDRGLGKVVPSKAQDWLFEDIVNVDEMRRNEYDKYLRLLLWFMDPEKIRGKSAKDLGDNREFFKPGSSAYFKSDAVIEFETLLSDILTDEKIRSQLTASICGIERCSYDQLQKLSRYDAMELGRIFISGALPDGEMLFAPLPNLIFTRDLGIVINDSILLNKPAKTARTKESVLTQYIFFNHPMFENYRGKIIELPDNERHFLLPDEVRTSEFYRTTLEGGDVMIVSPEHLIIGCSERTSLYAAQKAMKALFERDVVETITILKIPKKRDYMHIDTIFTQVKKNVWVLLKELGRQGDETKKKDLLHFIDPLQQNERLTILQFYKGLEHKPIEIENLEDLLTDISHNDLGSKEEVKFIYSGNGEFPYGEREQWTDSCNLLAIKDGVVLGYDRNSKTMEAFKNAGFSVISSDDLLQQFESGKIDPTSVNNTFISLPSAELSRARGGWHCMSLPLLRDHL